MASDQKILLVQGTNQNEKHSLVLEVIVTVPNPPKTVLFRANSKRNMDSFLNTIFSIKTRYETGKPYKLRGGSTIYIDSINRASQQKSPRQVDVAVVYPVDSLNVESGDENLHDLLNRGARKIIFVSWTDNVDISWLDMHNPMKITYDAIEENPAYHNRVKEAVSKARRQTKIKNLPNYAARISSEYLVKMLCRGKCNGGRWAQLNKPYPGLRTLHNAELGKYTAICLRCGYEADDNYNWYRP